MQRCPCCNAKLSSGPLCPRCKADFSLVEKADSLAGYWRYIALRHYLNEDRRECINALDQSLRIQHNSTVLQFRHFVLKQPVSLSVRLRTIFLTLLHWLDSLGTYPSKLKKISENQELVGKSAVDKGIVLLQSVCRSVVRMVQDLFLTKKNAN